MAELAAELLGVKLRAGDHLLVDARSGPARRAASRGPRSRSSSSKRSPTSPTTTSAASTTRSTRSRTRSSCRTSTRDLFHEHELAAAEGHPAVRPAGLRQDAHRQGGRELAREARRGEDGQRQDAARTSSTSRAPSCSTSTSARPSARSASSSSGPARRARRACPVIVFFDEMDSLFRTRGTGISLRHRVARSSRSSSRRSTASRA